MSGGELKILEIHQMVSFIVRPGFASRKMLIALGEISYKGINKSPAAHDSHLCLFVRPKLGDAPTIACPSMCAVGAG